MNIPTFLLNALSYARSGEFSLARDMLHDFTPRTMDDEKCVDYCWKRVDELEAKTKR